MSPLRRNIFLFSAVNFLQIAGYVAALVAYPTFLTSECGLGEVRAAALVGVLAISNLAAVLPLGLLSDRVSPRRLLQASQLCTAAFYLLLTVVRNEWLMVLLFVFGGVGLSGLRSLLPVLCYKYLTAFKQPASKPTPPMRPRLRRPDGPALQSAPLERAVLDEERRRSNVSLFTGVGFFGFGVGGYAGGLALAHSIRLPFYLAAGVAALLALWSGLLPDAKPEKIRWLEYLGDVLNAKVFLVLAIFVLMGLHFGVERYGLPKLITDGLGITKAGMGAFYLATGACLGVVVVLLRKFMAHRPTHFYYFGVGLIVSGLLQGLTFLAGDFRTLLAVRLVHVMGDGLVLMMMAVVVAGIFPGTRMGGNVGFANLVGTVGQFAGALLAGLCIATFRAPEGSPLSPYAAAFTISGAVTAVCGVVFLVFRRAMGVAERERSREDRRAHRWSARF